MACMHSHATSTYSSPVFVSCFARALCVCFFGQLKVFLSVHLTDLAFWLDRPTIILLSVNERCVFMGLPGSAGNRHRSRSSCQATPAKSK